MRSRVNPWGRDWGRPGAGVLLIVSAALSAHLTASLVACGDPNPTSIGEPIAAPRVVPLTPTMATRPTPTPGSVVPTTPPQPTPTAISPIPAIPPNPTQNRPSIVFPQNPVPTSTPPQLKALVPSTKLTLISKEIGPDGDQRTEAFRVGGADLGSVFDWNGKTYMLFGDTFSSFEAVPPTGIRQNTMAFSSDSDYSDGLNFDGWITDRQGYAKQLFSSDSANKHLIPTHGVAIGGTGYIYYQQVARRHGGGNWDVDLSSVYKSTDYGESWSRVSELTWAGSGNFAQVTFYKHDGYIYAFGTPSGRHGGVKLMRVAEGLFEDKSQYEYLVDPAGAGIWTPNNEPAAVTIVPAPAGELSITYNQFLSQYLMLYINPVPPRALVFRTAPTLIGPWSQMQVVARAPAFPLMYAPYTKEDFVEEDGRIIYFRMSRFDRKDYSPYSTYWMKLEFELP